MYERRVNTVSQYQLAQHSAHSLLSIPLVNNRCGGRLKNSKNPRPDLHSNQVTPPVRKWLHFLYSEAHALSHTFHYYKVAHTETQNTWCAQTLPFAPLSLYFSVSHKYTHTLTKSEWQHKVSGYSRRHCTACLSFSCFFISHSWRCLCSI